MYMKQETIVKSKIRTSMQRASEIHDINYSVSIKICFLVTVYQIM